MNKPKTWCIQLVFADAAINSVTLLGGAGWPSAAQQRAAWDKIPALPPGCQSNFLLDLLHPNGDILDDKFVSAEAAESFLGKPIDTLIEDGRGHSPFLRGLLKAAHPSAMALLADIQSAARGPRH